MSLGISSRLKINKKNELVKSQSQAQILATRLRQDGVMTTVENVMQAVDQVAALLASSVVDPTISYRDSVVNLCQHLKIYGAYLEMLYTDQLNHAFKVFRDKAQDDTRLDVLSRLHLLELVELRAQGWKGTSVMNQYYRKKVSEYQQVDNLNDSLSMLSESMSSMGVETTAPLLGPGEILKASGKFNKPTRIPGKKYCKYEIVIRNADSGKVNPGAKERLVQITGANEESITHAKQLIEDTIRRNASPVREQSLVGGPLTGSSSSINSSASDDSALPSSARASRALMHSLSTSDANIGEYKYTVVAGGHTLKITGDNLDLVRTSKLVLDEYFSGEPINDVSQFYSFDSLPQPIIENVDLREAPLSPPESLPSPGVITNGQNTDEADGKMHLRKPRLSLEEIIQGKAYIEDTTSKIGEFAYTIETLAGLAMSPMCLVPPDDWYRICKEYPGLVRKDIEFFNAKHYLSVRTLEPSCVLSADEVEAAEV